MILLVHAAPTTLDPHRRPNLGVLSTPGRWYRDVDGWPWAADNGAFKRFDEKEYVEMLDGIAELPSRPLFVAAPDVVGDAEATSELFGDWVCVLAARDLPIALVLQDGHEPGDERIFWDAIDAVFVGGSDEFKLGRNAADLVREAKRRGKWAHVGRVNSPLRMRYCASIGADSVDGSTHNRFRNIYLDRGVGSAAAPPQERLVP